MPDFAWYSLTGSFEVVLDGAFGGYFPTEYVFSCFAFVFQSTNLLILVLILHHPD